MAAEKAGLFIASTGVPTSRQLIQQIRMLVATGAWREGERVPSAHELAAHLRVNANTVQAAYTRLIRAGTLRGDPPISTSVAIGAKSSALLAEMVRETLAPAIGFAWSLGVPRELLEETLREIIAARYEGAQDKQEVEDA